MKVIGSVLAGLLVLIGAGAAYLVYAFPTELLRDEIIAEVKAKTGRDLIIAGPTSFTFYPSVGLSMRDVTLSAPPGMSGKPLVTMAVLDASVRLMPLLKRDIRVERLVLQKPVFELYTDAKGRKSWEFALASNSAKPVRLAQAGAPLSDAPGGLPGEGAKRSAGGSSPGLDQLQFGDVRIVDGVVRYKDAATGAEQEASAINVSLALQAINQPLEADGSLVWKGEKIDFDSKLNSIKAVIEDRPAKAVVKLLAAPLAATFDGTVAFRDGFDADGAVTAKSASVRAIAKWLGATLPPAKGFGALETKCQLRAAGKIITLSNAQLGLDGATATGAVTVETGGERPYVKASLQLSELDLNKYMRPDGAAPAAAPAAEPQKPARKAAPDGAGGAPAQSIDDLLAREPPPGPKVHGYAQRAGWSNDPIDFTALGVIDADAKLSVGKLLFQELKAGQSLLTVALKSRVLKTNFDDIQLYGGRGRGFITIDGTAQKSASIGANMSVDGLDALPFLKDAADFERLSGKARLALAVAGQGTNQRQLVETLNGKADFTFSNGAIIGLNIPGMVRGISQGKFTGLGSSPAEKTDFSELTATWTISKGIAQNQDLRLTSPLLRVTGAGAVMLPPRQVDYMMLPKLVSSLAGQGGKQDEAGLEIPVRIHGSWEKPDFSPDLQGIMKDPNKALDAVKEIGKQFKSKDANEIMRGLFGSKESAKEPGAEQPGTQQEGAQQQSNRKSLLDQLLKPPPQ